MPITPPTDWSLRLWDQAAESALEALQNEDPPINPFVTEDALHEARLHDLGKRFKVARDNIQAAAALYHDAVQLLYEDDEALVGDALERAVAQIGGALMLTGLCLFVVLLLVFALGLAAWDGRIAAANEGHPRPSWERPWEGDNE